MTPLMYQRIFKHSLLGIAAILVTLAMPRCASASLAKGPECTNAADAERQRVLLFYRAQQSLEEQLKVGRERYDQKQVVRAKVIAAMSSELQARQQTVEAQPMATPDSDKDQPISWTWPSLAVAGLVIGLIGFGRYRNRLPALDCFDQQEHSLVVPTPQTAEKSRADEVFFCKAPGVDGHGFCTQEGFVVLKGSMGRKQDVPASVSKSTEPLQVKLLDSGVMRTEGDTVIFEEDHLFRTPSMAAMALTGGTANGRLEWRTKDGKTLDTGVGPDGRH